LDATWAASFNKLVLAFASVARMADHEHAKELWQHSLGPATAAYERQHSGFDEWADLKELRAERAIRHLYDPEAGWSEVETLVKIDMDNVFASGAMRNCFRLKLFPRHASAKHIGDWSYAENFLGKMYIKEEIDNRAAVVEDVTMQMDCKKWADKFNLAASEMHTAARVDMIRIWALELIDRADKPMLCCERFIEGEYVKYNSNSGFIEETPHHTVRNTPQAFSHFTYVASEGQLIVVDVQGVGDLYTDPQVHSVDVCKYCGDANLRLRGIAYFFASHKCNAICRALKLRQLTTCDADAARNGLECDEGRTQTIPSHSPGMDRVPSLMPPMGRVPSQRPGMERAPSNGRHLRMQKYQAQPKQREEGEAVVEGQRSIAEAVVPTGRVTDKEAMQLRIAELEIPAEPLPEGAVHLEFAKMHIEGCFSDEPDAVAALFHLRLAAQVGDKDALWIVAQLYKGVECDHLPGLKVEEDHDRAAKLAKVAADRGVPGALFSLARSAPSLVERKTYYERAIALGGGDSAWGDGLYQLQHELAEILQAGGEGVDSHPAYAAELWMEAAEGAMGDGKMKLWQKYSALAEEAQACLDD